MKYLQNKNKIRLMLIFSLILFSGFFLSSKPAKAHVTEFTAFYLVTPDTTPVLKGTIVTDDPENTDITVTVNDGVDDHEYNATIDGNIWSATVTGALAVDDYNFSATATLDLVETDILPFNFLDVEEADFPFEFYFSNFGEGEFTEVYSIEFLVDVDEFQELLLLGLDDPGDNVGFSVDIADGTIVTASEGDTFPISEWYAETMDPSNNDLIRVIQFGIPDLGLNFSHPIDISVDVDASYNGRTLNIFTSETVGEGSASWEILGTCLVADGSCNFSVSHASYFGISELDDLDGSDHKGGLVYKKYREYKEKFKNKEDKQRYFKIKWLKKNENETYLYYKSIYEAHKFDSDSEFNKLSDEIKEIYKNYRGYEGHKHYREYKEKVY